VTPSTPPAFLWHTYEDQVVPLENALLMMTALRENGVPFEAHIYPHGKHGLSLATAVTDGATPGDMLMPEVTGWIDLACRWVQGI
jgi:acetyl esterase/lipase